jgi:ankyrin repeat protein
MRHAMRRVAQTSLHACVSANARECATLLLRGGASVDLCRGVPTPLYMAATDGNDTMTELLLSHGAATEPAGMSTARTPARCLRSPDMPWTEVTPLHAAAHRGAVGVIKLLLEHGADVDGGSMGGPSPLVRVRPCVLLSALVRGVDARACAAQMYAVEQQHEDTIKQLLARGANPNRVSDEGRGRTALFVAIAHQNAAIIRLLLEKRADAGVVDAESGNTPLHWAARLGHLAAVEMLLRTGQADVNARNKQGETPTWMAVRHGRAIVLSLLLHAGADAVSTRQGVTLLHVAAAEGFADCVHLLLSGGVDANVRSLDTGDTPLHLAASGNHYDAAERLLEGGARVNEPNAIRQTPLHIAAQVGAADVTELLMRRGAKVDAVTRDKQTPLLLAAAHGHVRVAGMLVARGASLTATQANGAGVLHVASSAGHNRLLRVLLDTCDDGAAAGAAAAGVGAAGGATRRPGEPESASPRAASGGAGGGESERTRFTLPINARPPVLATLLRKAENGGNTPLHVAAHSGNEDAVRMLVLAGADITLRNRLKQTPLDVARAMGHRRLAELLENVASGDLTLLTAPPPSGTGTDAPPLSAQLAQLALGGGGGGGGSSAASSPRLAATAGGGSAPNSPRGMRPVAPGP